MEILVMLPSSPGLSLNSNSMVHSLPSIRIERLSFRGLLPKMVQMLPFGKMLPKWHQPGYLTVVIPYRHFRRRS